MLRDNRGRFIKKAEGGTSLVSPTGKMITLNGVQHELLSGFDSAFAAYQKNHGTSVTMDSWLQTPDGAKYLKPLNGGTVPPGTMVVSGITMPVEDSPSETPSVPQTSSVPRTLQTVDINTWKPSQPTFTPLEPVTIKPSENLGLGKVSSPAEAAMTTDLEKIQYYYQNGQRVDTNGNPISEADFLANQDKYVVTLPPSSQQVDSTESSDSSTSAGVNLFSSDRPKRGGLGNINKTYLADFLDFTRAGLGASINNKIAERALASEKPLLQEASESHRSVFGDYRATVQGAKAAAQLRNLASKPLTSDGALQQKMQLDAQIQGQQYIDQGNAKDEELIRQTREVAWQQNKENQLQRHAVAMQNRQAMLMAAKNKKQIENMRDSANYSQVISPLLSGIETRIRKKAAEQQQYQDYYDQSSIHDDVWNTYTDGLTAEQLQLRDLYNTEGVAALSEYLGDDTQKHSDWATVKRILQAEERRRLAELHGVTLNTPQAESTSQYGVFGGSSMYGQFAKSGGTIYKAKLTKRTRDNDRASKSIESSKKIAARFLEKAMDSLYTYDQVELIARPTKKKRKYQAGGALPFVSYAPILATSEAGAPQSTAPTTSKKKSDDDDDEGLISKDIHKLLEGLDPLPIDMLVIEKELRNFENLSALSPTGEVPASVLTSRYFSILSKIKIAKFNRTEYTQALDQLQGNGGLNELAVTPEGRLIGTKDGDFEYFTPDQVNAGEHLERGYQLITNSNLLYLRANSPDGAFDHNLITVAHGGIGMEAITKIVNDAVQNLGNTTKEESGFVQIGEGGSIKAGLQFLQKAVQEVGDASAVQTMSVADYYQAGYLTEDQAQQAQQALQYVMSTLPANARALLQVKGGSAEGAVTLLGTIIAAKTSTKTQFKATPKKMTNTGSGSGSGRRGSSDDINDLELSPVQMMQLGYTDHTEITLQKGTKYAVKVDAQVLPLYDSNNKSLGVTTLDAVASSSFSGALDMNNVTMGGQLIDPHAMQNVQIDGSNLYVMNLPIDKSSPDGTIKPDLAWLQKIEAIDKTIRDQGITDIDTINALYTEAGLPVLMDSSGQLNTRDYCKFGVLNGHALSTAFQNRDVLDDTVVEIEDEDQIENIMRVLNKGKSEKNSMEFDAKPWWDVLSLSDYDTMLEGTIYIPVRTNPFTGMMGGGKYPTAGEAAQVEALVQQKERTRGYVDPGLLTD